MSDPHTVSSRSQQAQVSHPPQTFTTQSLLPQNPFPLSTHLSTSTQSQYSQPTSQSQLAQQSQRLSALPGTVMHSSLPQPTSSPLPIQHQNPLLGQQNQTNPFSGLHQPYSRPLVQSQQITNSHQTQTHLVFQNQHTSAPSTSQQQSQQQQFLVQPPQGYQPVYNNFHPQFSPQTQSLVTPQPFPQPSTNTTAQSTTYNALIQLNPQGEIHQQLFNQQQQQFQGSLQSSQHLFQPRQTQSVTTMSANSQYSQHSAQSQQSQQQQQQQQQHRLQLYPPQQPHYQTPQQPGLPSTPLFQTTQPQQQQHQVLPSPPQGAHPQHQTTSRDPLCNPKDPRGHQVRSLLQTTSAPIFPLINIGAEEVPLQTSIALFDQLYDQLVFLLGKSLEGSNPATQNQYESALCYSSAQLLRIYFEICNYMYEDSLVRYPSPELQLHELPDGDSRRSTQSDPRPPFFSHNKPIVINNNHLITEEFYIPTSLCPELGLSTIIPLDPIEVVARLGHLPANILSRLYSRVHGENFAPKSEKVGSFEYLVRLTKLNQMGLTLGQLQEVEGLGTMGARMNRIRKNVFDRWILVTKTSPEADQCVSEWITRRLPQLPLQSYNLNNNNEVQIAALAAIRQCLPQSHSAQDIAQYQRIMQQHLIALPPSQPGPPRLNQVCVVRGTKRKTASLHSRTEYFQALRQGFEAFQKLYPLDLADIPLQHGLIFPPLSCYETHLDRLSNCPSTTTQLTGSTSLTSGAIQQQQFQQLQLQLHHQLQQHQQLNPQQQSTPLPSNIPTGPQIHGSFGLDRNYDMGSNSSIQTSNQSQNSQAIAFYEAGELHRNASTVQSFDNQLATDTLNVFGNQPLQQQIGQRNVDSYSMRSGSTSNQLSVQFLPHPLTQQQQPPNTFLGIKPDGTCSVPQPFVDSTNLSSLSINNNNQPLFHLNNLYPLNQQHQPSFQQHPQSFSGNLHHDSFLNQHTNSFHPHNQSLPLPQHQPLPQSLSFLSESTSKRRHDQMQKPITTSSMGGNPQTSLPLSLGAVSINSTTKPTSRARQGVENQANELVQLGNPILKP